MRLFKVTTSVITAHIIMTNENKSLYVTIVPLPFHSGWQLVQRPPSVPLVNKRTGYRNFDLINLLGYVILYSVVWIIYLNVLENDEIDKKQIKK